MRKSSGGLARDLRLAKLHSLIDARGAVPLKDAAKPPVRNTRSMPNATNMRRTSGWPAGERLNW
jgi:hypothetical protein